MTPEPKQFIVPLIDGCARCGGQHTDVEAKPLTQPMVLEAANIMFSHWATCPSNGEPIMVSVRTLPTPIQRETM